MRRVRINFGAAIAVLLASACSPNSSTSRAGEGAAASASTQPAATDAPDPLVSAADRGRIAGDTSAKTWFIIASDFQCPYCRQWHEETYKPFIDEYVRSGKVRAAYINFPLGQHRNAVPTAEAAMCASAQGKFWEYHDALFVSQQQWSDLPDPRAHLDSLARSVGVDFAEWSKCADSDRMLPLINADRDRASAGGVRSTPTFLINGQAIPGAQRLDVLRPVIEAAIAKSGETKSQ